NRTPPTRGESPPPQYERDVPLSLDRGGSAARRQGCDIGQLDRLRDLRRQGQGQILDGVGDQPSRLERQCRRDRRLRSRALEDRERELQRSEKSRLRTRAQFRPRPEVSRDDAGGPQSARLRLACSNRPGKPLAKRRSSEPASSPTSSC